MIRDLLGHSSAAVRLGGAIGQSDPVDSSVGALTKAGEER